MAIFWGIDFGTTNSAVASITAVDKRRTGIVKHIGIDDRQPLPSYVAINEKTGEVKTGKDAKKTIVSDSEYKVFKSIKSVIDEDKKWVIAGEEWSPVRIATELFKSLKENGERICSEEMKEAVIAVPVGFSPKKKSYVREAAKNAGIEVKMFISEPTAAYCCRIDSVKKYKNIAVFDWGGGTLDVVVLQVEGNYINELSSVGLKLAGNDIDLEIANKVCLKSARKKKADFTFDDLSEDEQLDLLGSCEDAKCELADSDVAKASVISEKYGIINESIDYDYFSLIIENYVDQAIKCLLQALSEAGMNRESIDCIMCEGGSSRLRPLQEKLLLYFEKDKLMFPRTAMWDIACGASEISYRPGCYALNRPIGILQSNNKFYPLLSVGQRVPTAEKNIKFGVVDTTDEARFVLCDGEEESQSFLEYFPVKMRGFSDEVLEVSCYVDADMVFRMKVRTNRMPDDVFRVWTYSKLVLSYEIEATEDEKSIEIKKR